MDETIRKTVFKLINDTHTNKPIDKSIWERRALVNLESVRKNVEIVSNLVSPADVMAVVKADAYGHGASRVAQTAIDAGARWIGCAHVTEALALREYGIDAPILAWLHTVDTQFEEAISSGIDLGASGWELERIAQAARNQETLARVHLKIDTGLGRNGATLQSLDELLKLALKYQNAGLLRVVGIFSHLAVADEPHRTETDEQIEKFNLAIAKARSVGLTLEKRHLANTAAIFSRPDAHYDMVRLGLGLYGLSPFEGDTLSRFGIAPAMSIQARVSNVKMVSAGHGVSYGLSYRTAEETYLALIPLGYGDGLPRNATGAPISINGRNYPVRGRIAMDQCVVDLGPNIHPGDFIGSTATFFGEGGPSVNDWAKAAGTINYELVTRVTARLSRIYQEH